MPCACVYMYICIYTCPKQVTGDRPWQLNHAYKTLRCAHATGHVDGHYGHASGSEHSYYEGSKGGYASYYYHDRGSSCGFGAKRAGRRGHDGDGGDGGVLWGDRERFSGQCYADVW